MNLEQELLKNYSREHTIAVCTQIVNDKRLFGDLWEILKNGEPPLPQRAGWVLSHLGEADPGLLRPYFGDILALFHKDTHDGVHRGLARALTFLKVPEEYEGDLYDLAISWIPSPARTVAIRVHLMVVAANIAMPYPELREELATVIEAQMDWGSAGYKSRARRLLKKLRDA